MLGHEEKISPLRLNIVQYTVLAIFLVLAFGLWRLQVNDSEKYGQLAERNRIKDIPILAPRGKILDREGRVIVDNYPSRTVLLLRDQVRDLGPDLPLIAEGLHIPLEELQARLRKTSGTPAYQPVVLKEAVSFDELAFVEAHRTELPELETVLAYRRLYPRNGFMAHLIGYVGEVSETDLQQPQFEVYRPGAIVGKSGVEQVYNDMLIGKDGSRQVVVNSRGKELEELSQISPEPGHKLTLTIDLDLQMAAEQALEGNNGAIVALDPRTGEVLAMVSRPTFDPNDFAVRVPREEWRRLTTDPGKPLLNKAIQSQLPPGSVFKIIMSVAGLEEGVAQTLRVYCTGGKVFYGRLFKCHAVHGDVQISRGIYQSCDSFFYTLGERLGIARIARYAQALGLGQRTSIDLPGEVSGVMPSEEWKARTFKQKWYAGETISVSIGQGAVATTPIQLAHTVGGIAMDGVLKRPHVAFPDSVPEPMRKVSDAPDEVRVPINPRNWELITDAMAAVTGPGGTAPASHLENIDFAGKTGSAQVISNDARKKLLGSEFKDNGWFAGFAPRRNPEVVVVVLVEQGEHGSRAARLASQVIKAFVDKKRLREGTQVAGAKPEPDRFSPLQPAAATPIQGGR